MSAKRRTSAKWMFSGVEPSPCAQNVIQRFHSGNARKRKIASSMASIALACCPVGCSIKTSSLLTLSLRVLFNNKIAYRDGGSGGLVEGGGCWKTGENRGQERVKK